MTSSEQLEREAEQTRAHISATLDELRARTRPGEIVDQLVDYASGSGGGMFLSNLRQQVINNPVPVALVGAGIAWLAMSNRRGPANGRSAGNGVASTARDRIDRAGDSISQAGEASLATGEWMGRTASDMTDAAGEGIGQRASDMTDAARSGMASIGDAASDAYDTTTATASAAASGFQNAARSTASSIADTASSTYGAATSAYGTATEKIRNAGDAVKGSASGLSSNLSGARRGIMAIMHDQPLVLAGIGVALGALLGAALPASEIENQVMGEESDALKRRAGELADEQIDKGRAVADQAWKSVKEESENQGILSGPDGGKSDGLDANADWSSEGQDTPLAPAADSSTEQKYEPSQT